MPRPTSLPPALGAVAGTVSAVRVVVPVLFTVLFAVLAAIAGPALTGADAAFGAVAPGGTAAGSAARTGDPPKVGPKQVGPKQGATAEEADPLEVHLTTVSPPVIPERGRIRVKGTITNRSTEEWTSINLHAFRSTSPITDRVSLAAAAATDPAEPVGTRITEPGTFDTIESLLPGETTDFSLAIPRDQLGITGEPGVYWFGVHALGESSVPRDDFSDGRARTFLPLVERSRPQVEASLVVPVRGSVRHRPDGRVADVRHWTQTLAEGGRLHDLLDSASAADAAEATWLVDPAIPDAVAQLAAGNPPRSLAPDPDAPGADGSDGSGGSGGSGGGDGADGDEESGSASPDPSPTEPSPTEPEELSPAQQRLAELATEWLDDFGSSLSGESVLALPYGDLDVEAAAEHGPVWRQRATERADQVMERIGVDAEPALASRTGVLSGPAIDAADPGTTVLLSDTAFVSPPEAPDSLVDVAGHEVVITSSGAAGGGPAPEAPDTALALRQRVLSEAALRMLDGTRAPLVVVLPGDWHPVDATTLFGGLDRRWLEPVPVADVAVGDASPTPTGELVYTDEDREAQLDEPSFAAANELRATSRVLDKVLAQPSTVVQKVTDEALTALSYASRSDPLAAVSRTRAATARLEDLLASVRVEVPRSVTLSSTTGTFAATVVNELPQPVVVGLEARSEGSLELVDPPQLELAPESRSRVLLDVTAHRLGIHNVELVVTDASGRPLGSSAQLPIRAAQVSQVIWVIIAISLAILFGAIAVRLVRRVRTARSRRP